MVVFFQFVLLAGYGYAHLLCTRLAPRAQLAIHLAVLGVALLALPVAPSDLLKPSAGSEPITGILAMLGVTVGLPYFAVSTTGPLVQAWFARTYPRESPYWLYALSNAGSLLALLSYPFLIEPLLGAVTRPWSGRWLSRFSRSFAPRRREIAVERRLEDVRGGPAGRGGATSRPRALPRVDRVARPGVGAPSFLHQ
jgi:hypothetical protein